MEFEGIPAVGQAFGVVNIDGLRGRVDNYVGVVLALVGEVGADNSQVVGRKLRARFEEEVASVIDRSEALIGGVIESYVGIVDDFRNFVCGFVAVNFSCEDIDFPYVVGRNVGGLNRKDCAVIAGFTHHRGTRFAERSPIAYIIGGGVDAVDAEGFICSDARRNAIFHIGVAGEAVDGPGAVIVGGQMEKRVCGVLFVSVGHCHFIEAVAALDARRVVDDALAGNAEVGNVVAAVNADGDPAVADALPGFG